MSMLPVSNISLTQISWALLNAAPDNTTLSSMHSIVSGQPSNEGPMAMSYFLGYDYTSIASVTINGVAITGRQTSFDTHVSIDATGNTYAFGSYTSVNIAPIANLNGSPSSFKLPVASGQCPYIVGWNASGQCQLAGALTTASFTPYSITTTSDNRIHVVGVYNSATPLVINNLDDGSQSAVTLPASASNVTGYIVFSASGVALMAADIFAGGSTPWSIRASGDSVYITGQYTSGAIVKNLSGSTSSITISGTQGNDPFLLKFNSSGVCTDGTNLFSGGATDIGRVLEVDVLGNVYVAGQLSSGATNIKNLVTGTSSAFQLGGSSQTDAFLTRHDSNGLCTGCANIVAGAANDMSLSLAHDGSNLYVGGFYQSGSVVAIKSLPNNIASRFNLPITPGVGVSFVAKINSFGNIVGGAQILNTNAANQCTAIGASSNEGYVFGNYSTSNSTIVRNLNNTDSIYTLPSTNNISTAYGIRYNSNGACTGASHIVYGTGQTRVTAAKVQGNKLFVVGNYVSSSNVIVRDFTNSITSKVLQSASQAQPFLLTYPIPYVAVASSPISITSGTLNLWYDASDTSSLTLSGSSVLQWRDKSGSENHAVVVAGMNAPVLTSNVIGTNKPGVVFDAVNKTIMSLSSPMTPTTFFMVGKTTSMHNNNSMVFGAEMIDYGIQTSGQTGWSGGYFIKFQHSTTQAYIGQGRMDTQTLYEKLVNNPINNDTLYTLRQFRSTNSMGLHVNGGAPQTLINLTANWKSAKTTYFGGVWDNLNITPSHIGPVGEVLVYDQPLNDSDMRKVEGYLAWKWNLVGSLPSTHPYKSAAPI